MSLALVVEHTADQCRVRPLGGSELRTVGYTEPFRPRADSIGPGCLVAIDTYSGQVAWRWFPATVRAVHADRLELDEPFHGVIEAPFPDPRPEIGDIVYATTGLSDGWRIDATVDVPERAAATLQQVAELYARNGWA